MICPILIAFILPCHAGWAAPETNPAALRLQLEFSDGSRLVGIPVLPTLPIQTAFAKMDLPWKQITGFRLEADQTAVAVDLQNGDRLQGSLLLKAIELETAYGKITVAREHLRRIAVYQGGASGGLVLDYNFDQDQDGQVRDGSGHNNHGRAAGPITYVEGIAGQAIRIATPEAYIEAPAKGLSLDGAPELTVAVWFRIERLTTYGTILNSSIAHGPQTPNILELCINVEGLGRFTCGEDVVLSKTFTRGNPPPLGKWQQIVATVDARMVRLYVNGVLDVEQERLHPGAPLRSDADTFTVGKCRGHREHWRDSYPHGTLDQVRIWRRALTKAEIEQLYSAKN
jgi:hypothetical protein